MHKWQIVLVPFPFTDLSGAKVRPALVLYSSARGEDCIVAFISSRTTGKKINFGIQVHASFENGLKVESVICVDKIATLEKKIIIGELGTIEITVQKKVDVALKKLFLL